MHAGCYQSSSTHTYTHALCVYTGPLAHLPICSDSLTQLRAQVAHSCHSSVSYTELSALFFCLTWALHIISIRTWAVSPIWNSSRLLEIYSMVELPIKCLIFAYVCIDLLFTYNFSVVPKIKAGWLYACLPAWICTRLPVLAELNYYIHVSTGLAIAEIQRENENIISALAELPPWQFITYCRREPRTHFGNSRNTFPRIHRGKGNLFHRRTCSYVLNLKNRRILKSEEEIKSYLEPTVLNENRDRRKKQNKKWYFVSFRYIMLSHSSCSKRNTDFNVGASVFLFPILVPTIWSCKVCSMKLRWWLVEKSGFESQREDHQIYPPCLLLPVGFVHDTVAGQASSSAHPVYGSGPPWVLPRETTLPFCPGVMFAGHARQVYFM